jgi:secreted trypsin-like serine protease
LYRRRVLKRILPIVTLIALAAAPAADAKSPQKHTPTARASIVGGHNATIADWPSIAFLLAGWDENGDGQIDSGAGCTGTVIAPDWIISAAHCAFQPNGDPIDAMVTLTGVADNTAAGGEAIAADRLVVDPHWNPQTLLGDALLIHLKSRSSRPPLPLAVEGGPYATVEDVPNAAGWGTIDEKSEIGTDVLKEAYLELQSDQTCAWYAEGFDPPTQTCAGTWEKAGACHGDSGGPLIVFDKTTGDPVLWGLTSYGPQLDNGMLPCELHAPAVFSWVPGFTSFVQATLAPPPGGGSGTPSPPPVVRPARDTTAPVLSRAALSTGRIKVARSRATLSFNLSEASAVTVTVLKKTGRAYKALSPQIPLAASAGTVSRKFSGRLGGKALKAGSYKLRIDAADSAGNAARPVTVSFKIVR